MKEQLLAAWQTHQRMNLLVLESLSENQLQLTLNKRGGRTIAQQFMHMHSVRVQWLNVIDRKKVDTISPFEKNDNPGRTQIQQLLESSSNVLLAVYSESWDNGGNLKSFKSGLLSFFAYIVSHESHHRGNMLLTLKQSGEKIPEPLRFGLWEWAK